jgi:hypothetical protein
MRQESLFSGAIWHSLLSTGTSMFHDLEVWLAGLSLLFPVPVFGVAWARSCRFYSDREIKQRQENLYLVALMAASVSTLAYLGYWGWRVCGLYRITLPLMALLILERFLYLSRLLSAVAIICFYIGRGPYRVLVVLTTLWVTLQIWMHDGIIHWA